MEYVKGDHFKFEEQDLNWILQKLAPDNGTSGCQINFPETILFSQNKVQKVIKQLDDGCLSVVRYGMNEIDLRTHLINISIERTKENQRRL